MSRVNGFTPNASASESGRVEYCDVCIVGAGIAGLNALFVASRHLRPGQKVVLIDRRDGVGGMWLDTYPYVRLHQPHWLFTVGDIKWRLAADPSYLATQPEVLSHLRYCYDVLRSRTRTVPYFGWGVDGFHRDGDGGLRIEARSDNGESLTVHARRLIKASGYHISPNDPLRVSSKRVRSVSPDKWDVGGAEMRADDSPVWVIGGGKTAMDTAHTVLDRYPGRKVNLATGSGTYFLRREQMFPEGHRRWWAGSEPIGTFVRVSRQYDGLNEAQVRDVFRSEYCISITPDPQNFLFGFLSDAEAKAIGCQVGRIVLERLVDVDDRAGVPHLIFAGGTELPTAAGSWIVNCTGYLLDQPHAYEPYVSHDGAVLSINMRSATLQLSSLQSYFMSHLFFAGRLAEAPLYELDMEALRRTANSALPYALMALNQYNLSVMADQLPINAFLRCGLDYSRWFPLPRRMVGATRFLLTHRRDRDRHRRTLDVIRERFDVRCGPLTASTMAWTPTPGTAQ